jgi:hypothetical protein
MRLLAPDWFRIITDLVYVGVPVREIARRLDLKSSESLLRSYRAGVQPTYVRGEALIEFWASTLKRDKSEIPRVPWLAGHRAARRIRPGRQPALGV